VTNFFFSGAKIDIFFVLPNERRIKVFI
jgi:hypothetical protein